MGNTLITKGTNPEANWSDTMDTISRDFVWIPEPVEGFDYADLCEQLEEWMNDHEDAVSFADTDEEVSVTPSVRVRRPRGNEACGLYIVTVSSRDRHPADERQHENGNLQILGYTVAVPERLRELTDAAFNAVCCG